MQQATLFTPELHQTIGCLACSWYCRIAPGRTGICATRFNQDGTLYSLVYGKTTGLSLDPVEKKPLHHFLPGAKILSFGTVGCNFGCMFCQNAWMSQTNKDQISNIKYQKEKIKNQKDIINILHKHIDKISTSITPQEIVDKALEVKAAGIAYTYNEPAIFIEYARDTAKLAKAGGLKNIFVSNGFESVETFNYIKPYLDAINIDLKSFREDFYRKICHAKLQPVLENIKRYFSAGIETEVTTLVIPGHNDSDSELHNIADFLVNISSDIPWHISAFKPEYQMLNVPETPHEILLQAYDIGKKAGLKYIYVGNIEDDEHSSTFCPKCNGLLIKRHRYDTTIVNINLNTGVCRNCGEKIYGVWS